MTYQIDPAHTGAQPNDGPVPPLTLRWSVKLAGSISYPLIAGGRVFVTTAGSAGQGYGTLLYALDQQTGATLWGPTTISGTYFWSNAAYDGGKIFVINFDGLLRSFDAATGTAGWSTKLPGQYAFSSPPTAVGGTVYVGGAGSGGTLYAVDEANGAVLWTQGVENGDNSSPAVSATGVYVGYACDQVYDFNPTTGASIWHYSGTCEGGGGRTPALYGGNLYARDWATSNAELDAQTGAFVRSFSAGPIPAFSGSQGFFLSSGTLQAIELSTWATAWSFAGDGSLDSAPIVAGGNVWVGSSTGMLYALDPATGATMWSTNVGSTIPGPDEQNVSQPLTGLAAAAGALVVPAGDTLVAYW